MVRAGVWRFETTGPAGGNRVITAAIVALYPGWKNESILHKSGSQAGSLGAYVRAVFIGWNARDAGGGGGLQ
jgi:hypothetical protein